MAITHRRTLALPLPAVHRPSGRLLAAGAIVLVVAAAVLQVYQLTRTTSTGYDIDALEQLRAARQAQQHRLEADVAQLSSLGRVDWEARTRLGLQPAQRQLYIGVNQPVPERQTLPARYLPSPMPAPPLDDPDDRLWKQAVRLLPFF
ncbi:MAG: hypothetical protein WEC75_10795 [Dehalococcoidia bacterium]